MIYKNGDTQKGSNKETIEQPSALITGGSRGIGLGIAKELAKEGFNLAINGVRDLDSVQPVLNELKEFGVDVIYARGDISKKEDRENQILLQGRK